MVRISILGMESIAEKAHEAVQRFLIEDRDDEEGAEYFHKTWSLPSGHGRWSAPFSSSQSSIRKRCTASCAFSARLSMPSFEMRTM